MRKVRSKSGGFFPDPVAGQHQLVVQLQGRQTLKVEGIHQLDRINDEGMNAEIAATITFISDYGDEDVKFLPFFRPKIALCWGNVEIGIQIFVFLRSP